MKQTGVLVERLTHIGVFLPRAGEQLDGEDVGVGIDDAAGEHRARPRHIFGAVAHARHHDAQQHQIGHEPRIDRQRKPPVG